MSWQIFKDNLVKFHDNPDSINDIDIVAKKWADEYDAAIKRGGDTINKIKLQRGNKEIMEQLFKAALQQGLTSTAPYDLVGEMGKGVLAYWQGAIMQNVPIPIQLPPGATANVSVTSNVVINPGQWTPPQPGVGGPYTDPDIPPSEMTELDIVNNIDMPSVEEGIEKPITEEEIALELEEFGNLEEFRKNVELNGIPTLESVETELIEEPAVIDYETALPIAQPYQPPVRAESPITELSEVETEFKAVLVGGLDYRKGDLKIDQQEELFKQGFGNVKIKAYRYTVSVSDVTSFLNENPKLPIFLFSAGCTLAEGLSKSSVVDNKNLFIIEPYVESANTKKIVENAIKNGVPASNVYAGPNAPRGNGISGASQTPSGIDHWGSLKYVASQKSSLAGQKFFKARQNVPTNNGGNPVIYSNVGKSAAGIPPGYEVYQTDRSHIKRPNARKPDGPNGGIPYDKLKKVSRPVYGSGYLHPEAAVALELFLDVCAQNNVSFEITPGGGWYRDYNNQIGTWNEYGPAQAAVPGHSNHGWGIAIDIRTLYRKVQAAAKALKQCQTCAEPNAQARQSDLYKFFAANAPKFGWFNPSILADNSKTDEAWHWEYHGFSTMNEVQRKQMLATFNSTPRKNLKG